MAIMLDSAPMRPGQIMDLMKQRCINGLTKIGQIRNTGPSKIPVMGDAYKAVERGGVPSGGRAFLLRNNRMLSAGPYRAHSGGSNYLWLDGHVETNNELTLNLVPWYYRK